MCFCVCACVFVWCVCVCLVNLFRLFSLLQTHANEIEWKRDDKHSGTNRQPHLSLSNTALLTASLSLSLSVSLFFSHLVFHASPLSLSLTHTWLHSAIQKHTGIHARVPLKAHARREGLYHNAPTPRGRISQTLHSPWRICR